MPTISSTVTMEDNVSPTHEDVDYITLVKPVLQSVNDFISDELAERLATFFATADFKDENGHRVASYGERYVYTGSSKTETKKGIPSVIEEVIALVNNNFPETVPPNQASINEYPEDGFIAEHSDNEDTLCPESSIFTLTIGDSRTVSFTAFHDGRTVSHEAVHKSLYCMARESQNYWSHQINKKILAPGKRYALTLRTVGPCYKKSLLVIGDSNARKYKFGTGKGKMGYWTPGKVEFAAKVNDIKPLTYNTQSYRNILVQVGVNDLKSISTPAGVKDVSDRLVKKCNQSMNINPKCKLYVCPVLPTRDFNMNKKVMYMNRFIQIYANNTFNVTVLDCNEFVDNHGLLRRNFCSKPGDPIHINNTGVSKIVTLVKSYIHYRVPFITKRTSRVDGRLYASVTSVNRGREQSGVSRSGNVNMMNAPLTTTTIGDTLYMSSQQSQS